VRLAFPVSLNDGFINDGRGGHFSGGGVGDAEKRSNGGTGRRAKPGRMDVRGLAGFDGCETQASFAGMAVVSRNAKKPGVRDGLD
jgi:hypothetical protein